MGYNTTVFILNDMLDYIQRDPERFYQDILDGLHSGKEDALGQSTIMQSNHADVFRLYGTHRNSIIELSRYSLRTRNLIQRDQIRLGVVERFIRQAEDELDSLKKFIEEHKKNVDIDAPLD